jgi:hypothetical protein
MRAGVTTGPPPPRPKGLGQFCEAKKHRPQLESPQTKRKNLAKRRGSFLGAIGLEPTETEVEGFTVLGRPMEPCHQQHLTW